MPQAPAGQNSFARRATGMHRSSRSPNRGCSPRWLRNWLRNLCKTGVAAFSRKPHLSLFWSFRRSPETPLRLQTETKDFPGRGPACCDVGLSMRTISEQTVGNRHREFQKCGVLSYFREIVTKLRNAAKVPIGYQDIVGFHFGVERYAPDGPRQLVLARFHQSRRGPDAILTSMRHRVV